MTGEQIKSERVAWNDEAAEMLKSAAHNCSIEDLEDQVSYGASLFRLTLDDELLGYYILRVDHLKYWSEAVFVAGAGKTADFDLPKLSVLLAEKQTQNCKYLRIHTARAGVVKKLTQLGYKPQEFIMMKELN